MNKSDRSLLSVHVQGKAACISCTELKNKGFCSVPTIGHTPLADALAPSSIKCDPAMSDTGSSLTAHQ